MYLYHIFKFILLWTFSLDQGVNETLELNDFQRQIHSPPATVSLGIIFPGRGLWFHASAILIQYIWGKVQEIAIFLKFFFYWKIIASQNFAVFCQTSTWIIHRHIHPLPCEPPSHLPPHPTPLDWYRAPVWIFWAIEQILKNSAFFLKAYCTLRFGN